MSFSVPGIGIKHRTIGQLVFEHLLGELKLRNGGLTATHRLELDNNISNGAVDAGERLGLVDQRGFPVTDVVGINQGGLGDIGSYETSPLIRRSEKFSSNIRGASQFGSGDAFIVGVGIDDGKVNSQIPKEPGYLGLDFDPAPFDFGGISEGNGAELKGDVDARLGIEYGYYVNGGSVDTFYDGLFTYSIDDSNADDNEFTISTGANPTDGQFYTTSPQVSAYEDLVFELDVDVTAKGCLAGGAKKSLFG